MMMPEVEVSNGEGVIESSLGIEGRKECHSHLNDE